ncbi:MAG: TonB-dependent receptor [Gammaproteobacteria bacterium]|nr:TonB-dependent receptor [Gammaproteobacteria bacterium]
MTLYKELSLKSVITILVMLIHTTSFAQSNKENIDAPFVKKDTDEIVVTARKREESLQDVPISITAFSADQLQSMGLNNNDAVATMTVNFNTMAQLGRRLDRPVIRGMASPETFGEPNASYFIDGAYLSGSISAYTLGPVERVEILRGPQSAQFGRATFSGAVNYVTRKPTNNLEGELTLRVGDEETRTYAGWVSGPVIEDKLMFFASGSYDKFGSEWNNDLKDGEAQNTNSFINPPQYGDTSDLGGTKTKQVEGKLLWLINDSSELTFKAAYVHGDDEHYSQLIVETSELNCYRPGIDITDITAPNYSTSPGAYCGKINPDNRRNAMNIPDFLEGMQGAFVGPGRTPEDYIAPPKEPGAKRDQYNFLISLDQDIADWSLTSRAAFNKSELKTAYDLDGYPSRDFTGQFHFYEELERKDFSLESRLDSPGGKSIRGTIGAYYYHFKENSANAARPGITGQGQLSVPIKSSTNNYALFGAFDWDLTDKWSFTTEARWSRDEKEIRSPNTCSDPASAYYKPKYDGENGDNKSKNAFTPRFTLRYEPSDDVMVYIQAAKGNKPGAYNIGYFRQYRDACFAAQELENGGNVFVTEEKQWTYEAGTKTSWFSNQVTANLAVFYIDWENQTFFETTGIPGEPPLTLSIPTNVGFNSGKSRIFGLELETTWAITDKIHTTFAYGLADGKYREGYSENYEQVTGDGNLKGNKIPNSPKHSFVTSLTYIDQINSELGWFSRTDYSYENGRYSAANNFAEIGKRQIWNARSGLETDRWTATLYVNNILDKNTPSAIIGFPRINENLPPNPPGTNNSPQGYALSPTSGRIWGGEIVIRFGAHH